MSSSSYSKVESINSTATCDTTSPFDLFVNKKVSTDLFASKYLGGFIVNDEMIIYDENSFNGGCDKGEVLKVNLNTGSVTNTTYTVNYDAMSMAGKPIYYDGTQLWLLPNCGPDSTLVTTTGATKPYNRSLLPDNYKASYAKVNGIEYFYWFDSYGGEVYSYNINNQTKTSLNLKSKIQQQLEPHYSFTSWQKMILYNNTLIWEPDGTEFKLFSLLTNSFNADWDVGGFWGYDGNGDSLFASTDTKIVFVSRPLEGGLRNGYDFITISSTPSAVTNTPVIISSAVSVWYRASGSYYTLTPSGTYNYYRGILGTDVAFDCRSSSYLRVDDYHILLGGKYTYFASSTPNTLTIGHRVYEIVPTSKLPTCLPSLKSTLVSFDDLYTDNNYDNIDFFYSSRRSYKLLLVSYGSRVDRSDGETRVYNTDDNTVGPLNVIAPPKPSTPQPNQNPAMPPDGKFYYPVSISTEFDYWLYEDKNIDKCKLISSINATDVITIPGTY